MNTKILLISNMYPSKKYPAYGIFVKNFIDNLMPYYSFTEVVIQGRHKNKIKKTFTYLSFYKKILFNTFFNKSDFIYVHYISQVSPLLFFLMPFIKHKLILNFHGTDMLGKFSISQKIMFFFTKKISKQALLVVVPSSFFQKKAIELLEMNKEKIYIYPSGGVNLKQFYPMDKIASKKRFGLDSSSLAIGMVSSIYKAKGWKVFLEAIIILRAEISNLKVLIAGHGIEEKELLRFIEKNALENIVLYLGEKSHTELANVYNALDIFVFPTMLEESLGLVGLESMACGTPVIGSRIGGLTDYIKDDYNGYLFDNGSSRDLVLKIKRTLHKYRLNENAIKTALDFSSTKVSIELVNKLKELR